MRLFHCILLMAVLLLSSAFAHSAPQWSGRNRIELMQIADGTNYVRMQITSATNPAGCANTIFIDYQLDTGGRSAAEQRLILDAFNVALIMSQPVEFLIDDSNCSTAGTSSSVRIAVGFRIHRT